MSGWLLLAGSGTGDSVQWGPWSVESAYATTGRSAAETAQPATAEPAAPVAAAGQGKKARKKEVRVGAAYRGLASVSLRALVAACWTQHAPGILIQ